jgi:hypothetical protein
MKNRIIEICELGQPQSIIQRKNEPITKLIKTDSLIEELNEQLLLYNVILQSEPCCDKCGSEYYHTYKCVNTKCENYIIND